MVDILLWIETTDGERIKIAYDMMVNGVGERTSNIKDSIQFSYDNGITDEFIQDLWCMWILIMKKLQKSKIDAVICFNFRTDRCRPNNTSSYSKDMQNLI